MIMSGWFTREHTDGYVISTDPSRLDLDVIHEFLRDAYWALGRPRAVVERSIANSIPFGLYAPSGEQVGFARVVTGKATFAYVADVFVLPEHRGRGLDASLVESVLAHPDLKGVGRFTLVTADAHELYRRFGFGPVNNPANQMELRRSPDGRRESPVESPDDRP